MFGIFFQTKMKKVVCSTKKIVNNTVKDNHVIIEDEKKFYEYFLKEKNKLSQKIDPMPINSKQELSINKEKIEHHQENICEIEVVVPSKGYSRKEQVTETNCTKHKNKLRKTLSSLSEKDEAQTNICAKPMERSMDTWFQVNVYNGLKGGGDFQNNKKEYRHLKLEIPKITWIWWEEGENSQYPKEEFVTSTKYIGVGNVSFRTTNFIPQRILP